HDLGKLMFAFVFFWGYVAFSQFMLIWYANIPEETFFFEYRWHNADWQMVSLILIAVHFVLPFPMLMSRHSKRTLPVLAMFAVWMMIAHWVDMYWLVLPNFDWFDHSFVLHPLDVMVSLGLVGVFVASTAGALKKVNLIPTKDPDLGASLKFENI
ncbi:MAG: quinol:cytochrome C oxidoreductase, partial [Deltaproteobacteria bacterium]|nr:quinol:cytochrome C oxidoreductase [Deltaproteobacteria bacterium]